MPTSCAAAPSCFATAGIPGCRQSRLSLRERTPFRGAKDDAGFPSTHAEPKHSLSAEIFSACRSIAAVALLVLSLWAGSASFSLAETYRVGPDAKLSSLSQVPWSRLLPGDLVEIQWRPEPYRSKISLSQRGTAEKPIVIRGIPGPAGELGLESTPQDAASWLKRPDPQNVLVVTYDDQGAITRLDTDPRC